MLNHILVPLDGSDLALEALPYAKAILQAGGKLTLLSVVDVPDFPMYDFYPAPMAVTDKDYTSVVEDMMAKTHEYLDKLAEPYRNQGYTVLVVVKVGEPAQAIVEEASAAQADAIVMSTHGRTGFSRWLFGSVTQKVLNAMPCPIFVIPGFKHVSAEEKEATARQKSS